MSLSISHQLLVLQLLEHVKTPNIIQIVRNAKIAPITLSGSQKNVMTLSFKVAQLGSTTFTADHGSASGIWTTQHTLNNSAANMAGNYVATSHCGHRDSYLINFTKYRIYNNSRNRKCSHEL